MVTKYKLPQTLVNARVSVISPLQAVGLGENNGGSGYGFVLVDGKIMLGRGVLYILSLCPLVLSLCPLVTCPLNILKIRR
jgi:hypothetical protein